MRKFLIIILQIFKQPLLVLRHNSVPFSTRLGGRNFLQNSKLGKWSYIGNNSMLIDVKIGNYCSIAPFVIIGGMNHSYESVSTSPRLNNKCFYTTTRIGHDVWIGANAIVLQGVSIGNGAVIGAGSIVTKDIPENSIVMGTPAKVVKQRFTQEKWDTIKKLEYWKLPPHQARKILSSIE